METSVENLEMVRQSVRDFTIRHIKPHVADWDENQYFPRDVMRQIGQQGFLGVLVPVAYGGTGMTYDAYVTIIEEIAKVDPSIGLSVAAHNSLCIGHILLAGSEEQKKKYLPKLASGEWLGAWGLTEPGTGSDAMRMACTAEKNGGTFILNGTKSWITHGKSCDVAVVVARTGELLDSRGMTAFVLEKGTTGFSGGKKENKLGMRASETAEMIMDQCAVGQNQVLGQEGEGFIQAMQVLDGGRISIAALSLGIAKGAYEAAAQYAKERQQFGQPIINFQAIAFKLADMRIKIEAAELLTRKAAHLKDKGEKVTLQAAIAKYYASEACVAISNDAVQIHGGYGYTKDYPVEKYYRDSKLCTIGEGTSEIQKLVISREIMTDS